MRGVITSVLVLVSLGFFTVAVAQLQPEILADAYLLQMEQAIRDGDADRAQAVMQDLLLLQEENEVDLANDFHFRYAKAAAAVNLPEQALESVVRYLAAVGRDGEHYVEALELMNTEQDTPSQDSVAGVAAQLPPETLADAYLLQAEQAIREEDYAGARATMVKILSLQEENELDLPDDFHFKYAQVAALEDLPEQALESVVRYLTAAGRDGEHYVEALELMNTVQAEASCKGWNTDGYFETATLEQVTACLDTGVDLEARDDSGSTPLHRAASGTGNPAIIQALLAAGANVNARDEDGRTPLHLVVELNENPTVVQALLDAGADPMTQDGDGRTPLHYAVRDNANLVVTLLDAGADPMTQDGDGRTPLHYAVRDNANLVVTLLDAGADPMTQDGDGRTPLHYAVRDNANLVVTLLDAGADPIAQDRDGSTPLHYAARYNDNPAIIRTLLNAGADLEARSRRVEAGQLGSGDTVRSNGAYQDGYSYVGRAGQEVVVEVWSRDFDSYLIVESPSGERFVNNDYQGDRGRSLLSLSLDETGEYRFLVSSYSSGESGPYTLRIGQGDTPLHYAARYNANPAVIEALLAAGADLEEDAGNDGLRVLHLAARYNENPAVIAALLAAGADIEKADDREFRPLHYAATWNENPAVIEALLAAGADIEKDDDREFRPLHYAATWNENPAVIEALLAAGADLEEDAGNHGLRVLHLAAQNNENPAVIEALLAAGADLEEDDDSEYRPLHHAARWNENPAVIEALLAAGADLEARDDDSRTPLYHAARWNENPAVIETLLATGADRRWVLQVAARYNENPAVIALIEVLLLDANPDEVQPLLNSAGYNNENPAMIEVLLAAGADPNTGSSANRALHGATCCNENPAVAQVLLDAGADPNARDADGETPLHLAASRFNTKPAVIEALIDAGADLEALDGDGATPLRRAADNENPAAREILLAAGAGQTERQRAAARARQEAESGPGFLDFAVAAIGGAAIAVAGDGSDEAIAAGGDFAEGVLSGQQPVGNSGGGGSPDVFGSAGNTGITSGGGSCQIPGYPTPTNPQTLGLAWCPASVDFQWRVFALQAAGAQCAIATGSSSTPEQINTRHQEINAACGRLDALGVSNCQCPASVRP